MEIFGFFALIAVVFGIRILAGSMDDDRVSEYIGERGGKLISSDWAPFGTGWFGEKSDRIYEVRYSDRDGNIHDATCKTSMFTGVYFTEDRIIQKSPESVNEPPQERSLVEELELENRRLREELRRVRGY